MRVQRCKGTRDLSPGEMTRFRLIEGVFRDCCLKWGYQEVRTPTLEYLHLFTSTGTLTPNRLNRVYSFLDWDGWSGERIVLRPDGTIPVARLYIDSMAEKELARLFYLANVFVFEETGKEAREKWQCGVELIGTGSAIADVELIVLALEILKRLGLNNIGVKLSHAGLIRALLVKLGLSPAERAKLFDQILDGDASAMARVKLEEPESGKVLTSLLDLKGKSSGLLKNLKGLFTKSFHELEAPLDDFISIVDLLEKLGCDYQIDLASGRGFEYYTGVIFQLLMDDENIGGGGRYDALIPLMGGKDVPASGFALYLDRLMSLIKQETPAKPLASGILVKVNPEAMEAGFSLADYLREAGYPTELYLGGQQPANLRWTVVLQNKASLFVLTDRFKNRKFEAQTVAEVLTLLGEGEGANKNSTA